MLNFKGFVSLEIAVLLILSPGLNFPKVKKNDASLFASRKVQIASGDTIFYLCRKYNYFNLKNFEYCFEICDNKL